MPPRSAAHVSASSCSVASNSQVPEPKIDEMASLPNLQQRQELITRLLRGALIPLRGSKEGYLTSEQLKSCKVSSIKKLDFYSGKVVVGPKDARSSFSEQYICPMDDEKVLAFLKATGACDIQEDIDPKHKHDNRGWEAYFFWALIDTHLAHHKDENKAGFQITDTPWEKMEDSHMKASQFTQRTSGGDMQWQVMGTYQQTLKSRTDNAMYEGPLNPEKPHVVCFLTVNSPLDEGILASEMTVLAYLASNASLARHYQKHRFYPVTLIVGSDRNFRVTQGIFDIASMAFEIRQSRVVEFDQSVWEKSKEYLTLLGWLVGDAVGKTK